MTPSDEELKERLLAESMALIRVQYLDLLEAPGIPTRLRALRQIAADQWTQGIPYVRPLLDDDGPYAFSNGGTDFVTEVRATALEVLEELYRIARQAPDCGPVKARKPMPAVEAIARGEAALARLTPDERAAVTTRVEAYMTQRYGFRPNEAAAIVGYRTLQELGLIEYRFETIDPKSYRTPVQQEIIDAQTAMTRPRPHLRVAHKDAPENTLGWLYRDPAGRGWKVDFSDDREAADVADWVRRVLHDLDQRGVPRVKRDASGAPMVNADSSFVLDGTIALDTTDTVALLRNVQLFVAVEAFAEVVE